MNDLPKISIVVPNYNYGRTLRRTLQSLVDQDYPNLEIIVIDGGSNDDSVSVIKAFEQHLAYWVSEKDTGQSNAINKGFARATGDVVNWLCSDDYLAPGALHAVARRFLESEADVVAGATRFVEVGKDGGLKETVVASDGDRLSSMPYVNPIQQPSCFYRRSLIKDRALREDLHYTMDLELWCFFCSAGALWRFTGDVLSTYESNGFNKTSVGGRKAWGEVVSIALQYRNSERKAVWLMDRVYYPVLMKARSSEGLSARLFWKLANTNQSLLEKFYGQPIQEMARYLWWCSGIEMRKSGREQTG